MGTRQIRLREDTYTNWYNTNSILGLAEIGIDTTNMKFKMGDGSSNWRTLPYSTYAVSEIDTFLGLKSDKTHNHDGVYEPLISEKTAFNRDFAGTGSAVTISRSDHTHTTSSITNFSTHTHTKSQITDFAHTHVRADITDFDAHTHVNGTGIGGPYELQIATKYSGFNLPIGTTSGTIAAGDHLHTGVYEPAFTKLSAFNKDFGTTSTTVAYGNHTHTLNDLSDVVITSAANGDIVRYNGTNFVNATLASAGVAATGQTMYIGNTAVTINRSSGALSLTGVSIDGSAGKVANALTFSTSGGTTGAYDGSGAKIVSYDSVGAAAASHTHVNDSTIGGPFYSESQISDFIQSAMINTAKALGRATSSALPLPSAFINPISGSVIIY